MRKYFKEKKKLLIIIAIVFLLVTGVTYAWFSRQIVGNENAKEMRVETGTLSLIYIDSLEIEGKYVNPGWSETKTFKVTNTGTLDTNYTIWWKDFINTIEKDELVYILTCKSYSDYDTKTEGGNCYGFDEKAMNAADDLRILSNIAIPSGYTHEYEITILFKEMGSNQNYNQGKTFTGTINIKEYYENETELPVIESYDVENYVLTAKVTDNTGIVSYAVTYPIADLVPEDIEWIDIKSVTTLDLEIELSDYKAILWIKSRNQNIIYLDITPRPTLVVDPNGGTWEGNVSEQTYNMTYDETKEVSNPTREGYLFLGWIVESKGSESTIINQTFTMGEKNTTLQANWEKKPTLYEKILTDNNSGQSDENIDFSQISSDTNGKGLYYTSDLSLTEDYDRDGIGERVYYYRGAVENNNVRFGGYCWRIVRTNEDGSVRLRYNGTYENGTCPVTGTRVRINNKNYKFNSEYNLSKYNEYIRIDGSGESNAKSIVDDWYKSSGLLNYEDKIANVVYCADKSNPTNPSSGSYYAWTFYGAANRLINIKSFSAKSDAQPIYKCIDESGKHTVSGDNWGGTGLLTYPIGLLTADEVAYAGSIYSSSTTSNTYYLYTSSFYWLMSPLGWYLDNGNAYPFFITSSGYMGHSYVASSLGILPVISLKNDVTVLKTQDGSYTNPYIID